MTTKKYVISLEDIPNPERGFYLPTITFASDYEPLNASYLASKRSLFTPYNANYQVHTTLVFRYFVLDTFVDKPISTDFLSKVQADFDAARTAGVKLILRFSYTNTPPTGDCGSWICPPYGDAPKSRVLEHIGQLKPYLQNNADIIATVQMGFIGVWGENYYTDYFGDASQSPFVLTNSNWTDRSEVLGALLDAVPSSRTVQVRYPQMKQRYVYGLGAPTTSAPLTSVEAYSGSDKARLGFHNDCFLASDADFGTFSDYGPPTPGDDTTNLKPYLQDDTQYVPMGGETCSINNPDDDCAADGGRGDTEIRRFHYSYLNSEFNNDVNNDWAGSCLDEIKMKMGYRLLLTKGVYSNTVEAGQQLTIELDLENIGWTAPYNPRGVELVLRNVITGKIYFAPIDADPRFWLPGTHNIDELVCLPPNIEAGSYELLLNLPDPESTLHNEPNYSIQLANTNMWEPLTGYNDLDHTVVVTNSNGPEICYGGQMFSTISVFDPEYCESILNVNNPISTNIYRASDQVISQGQISGSEDVIFQSGDEVNLDEGFEVNQGGIFRAIILGCNE